MFVFSCQNATYDGAVLQPFFHGLDTITQLSLSQWAGKAVTIAGILYSEGERKYIQLSDIR